MPGRGPRGRRPPAHLDHGRLSRRPATPGRCGREGRAPRPEPPAERRYAFVSAVGGGRSPLSASTTCDSTQPKYS